MTFGQRDAAMHSDFHHPHEGQSSYVSSLNDVQREAVFCTQGPLLVLAGAGTGKTRVLTSRIAHILSEKLAYPSQILAVTFTNKAAQEMRTRVGNILHGSSDGLWIGTFHSIGVRILRKHADLIGLQTNFTILDTDDQLRLIKQIIKASDHFIDSNPKDILQSINQLKDKGITAERARGSADPVIVSVYQDYQDRLLVLNAADFGDLLLHNLTIFQKHPEVLEKYQQQFHYMLVDEYQDTNVAQYIWLRLLAQGFNNICCVGDEDQSIYGWRGAEIGNILRFEKDFPGAQIIRLEQNYRSTPPILRAASGLIAHNAGRYGKTLWTDQADGDPVCVYAYFDGDQEARSIAEQVEDYQRKKEALNSMAILVRASFQTRAFEECFMRAGIPYRVIGGPRFYERQEIRDCLAYLRIIVQEDDGLAFERIINRPKRSVGETTLQKMHNFSKEQGISLPKAARFICETGVEGLSLQTKTNNTLKQFFCDLDRWREILLTKSHMELTKIVLDESGYTAMWIQEKTPDAAARLENIKEFVQALTEFESIPDFLEHVSLVLETNNSLETDMVTLMTLHGAKGLEFDTVFLPGWEEGLFPHPRSFAASSPGIEEERRLAYVGLSRARKRALVSYSYRRLAPQGWQNSQPSRFIFEIPKDAIVHITPQQSQYTVYKKPVISNEPYAKKHFMYQKKYNQSTTKEKITILQNHAFKTGDRISHEKFHQGTVIAFEGDKLMIEFDNGDVRKIMSNFVTHV